MSAARPRERGLAVANFIGWVLRAYRYTRCFDASIAASADSVAPERLTGLVTMGGGAHLPKVP